MATRKNSKKRSVPLQKSAPRKIILTAVPKERAPVEVKLPLIPHHDNELTLAIANTIELIADLERRLAPVLAPLTHGVLAGAQEDTGVPLADSLITKTMAVNTLNAKVSELLERLAI